MNKGDQVVCINDKFDSTARKLYSQFPRKGSIYVIRDVRLGIQTDCKTGDVSLLLVGIVNPFATSKAGLERGFRLDRFSPLNPDHLTSVAANAYRDGDVKEVVAI